MKITKLSDIENLSYIVEPVINHLKQKKTKHSEFFKEEASERKANFLNNFYKIFSQLCSDEQGYRASNDAKAKKLSKVENNDKKCSNSKDSKEEDDSETTNITDEMEPESRYEAILFLLYCIVVYHKVTLQLLSNHINSKEDLVSQIKEILKEQDINLNWELIIKKLDKNATLALTLIGITPQARYERVMTFFKTFSFKDLEEKETPLEALMQDIKQAAIEANLRALKMV